MKIGEKNKPSICAILGPSTVVRCVVGWLVFGIFSLGFCPQRPASYRLVFYFLLVLLLLTKEEWREIIV